MENQRSTVILQRFLADPKNSEAFSKFARKYQPRIKRCCLARGLQDADAEDLTADILLRFCERDVFDGFVFQSKEKFYGWLSKVVRNAVLTFVRDRGRKPDAWSVGNADTQDFLQRVTEKMVRDLESVCEEDLARVQRACACVKAGVDAKTWQAFHLSVYEGRAAKEVTAQLEMSKEAVWKACSRIRRKLREELSDLHDPGHDEK